LISVFLVHKTKKKKGAHIIGGNLYTGIVEFKFKPDLMVTWPQKGSILIRLEM